MTHNADLKDMQSRLVELEATNANQQRFMDQLSDMVSEQWQTIDALKREMKRLRQRMESVESQNRKTSGEDAPPPHY